MDYKKIDNHYFLSFFFIFLFKIDNHYYKKNVLCIKYWIFYQNKFTNYLKKDINNIEVIFLFFENFMITNYQFFNNISDQIILFKD